MTEDELREAVAALLAAYETRVPIAPLSETYPRLDVASAYEIQSRQVAHWASAGRVVNGHKVGLTSLAMRRQLGVHEPDYGHLMADMFHLENCGIDLQNYLAPRVEPEIAFVLKHPITGPGITVADAIEAVDFVLPALEIIDSRIQNWHITLPDTIADNASSGGVVLGPTPVPLEAVDSRLAGCVLEQAGEVVATGASGAVLGSPINALAWLANTVGALGVGLDAGSIIMPGALTAAVPVEPGQMITARFHGLGAVSAYFAKEVKP